MNRDTNERTPGREPAPNNSYAVEQNRGEGTQASKSETMIYDNAIACTDEFEIEASKRESTSSEDVIDTSGEMNDLNGQIDNNLRIISDAQRQKRQKREHRPEARDQYYDEEPRPGCSREPVPRMEERRDR